MTIPATNSKLLLTQDWIKIYQSFPYAELQSYDFDTIRRVLITYLQENYPEDFNDFIESSEYIALVDLIAYLGQNLSFRIDLNARENFLATAQRRDSVLRLAQLVGYVPKRNTPASGLLKMSAISTTGNVFDSTGANLSNTTVAWNDSTNPNWYQQFLTILNSTMPGNMVFGNPNASSTVSGIQTQQYIVNSSNSDVPLYRFSQNINGTQMNFEIVPATFQGKDYVYEDVPVPGAPVKFIYQNDNQGASSPNTGFFALFKQGTMSVSGFQITNPVPNEIVGINVGDINDTDLWLWQLDSGFNYSNLWKQVPATTGNNVIYNSLNQNERNVFSASTRESDQVDLNFADGNFGNLPNGQFQLFYRQSNGLNYTIKPSQMTSVVVTIPYFDKQNQNQTLTIVFSLEYTVSNSAASESNQSIRQNAPLAFYSQNRMVTAEDYNVAPLAYTTNVAKVKSINRVSSGISKYFELSDVSGKYSSTNIFCDDGILVKNNTSTSFAFNFTSQNDIWAAIKTYLEPAVDTPTLSSFYYDVYRQPEYIKLGNTPEYNYTWTLVNNTTGQSRGYFQSTRPASVGPDYVTYPNPLYHVTPGALIKFTVPTNINGYPQYITPNGSITSDSTKGNDHVWATVQQVIGTGSNNGLGALANGTGPIVLATLIPNGAIPTEIVPAYKNILTYNFESAIVNLCLSEQTFGLTLSTSTRSWSIIPGSNLDLNVGNPYDILATQGTDNDSSWLVKFEWQPPNERYVVTVKSAEYIFQSAQQTGFYVDNNNVNFDYVNNTVVKDKISVLSVNPDPTTGLALGNDYVWQIDNSMVEPTGYIDPSKVQVSFYSRVDSNKFSQDINPDAFSNIVGTNTTTVTINGSTTILPGRSGLKFQYQHNPSSEVRIDPAKSNIIDIYMLTTDYDTAFRNWILTGIGSKPIPPTSQSLENNYASKLDPIKTTSDQIIYQPVSYKVLFGKNADQNLQATFKVVKNSASVLSDNDIISRVVNGINNFFALTNWDFGKSFYFSELSTYIMNLLTPNITNFVIIPSTSGFGNLYEISCQSNQIFISGATAADIQVISAATAAQLNISAGSK